MDRRSVTAVAALSDPTRAALFEWVTDAAAPVTREAAASAVGISRKLAAFHLDRLVEAGLLTAATAPPARRVGRLPKTYVPSATAVQVSVPPRDWGALAEILLAGIRRTDELDTSTDSDTFDESDDRRPASTASRVLRIAADRGRQLGIAQAARRHLGRLGPERGLSVAADILREHGYQPVSEPAESGRRAVRLRNCPFHPLAREYPELVCGLNEAFIAGILDGLGARGTSAVLAPDPAACCVRLETSAAAAAGSEPDRSAAV